METNTTTKGNSMRIVFKKAENLKEGEIFWFSGEATNYGDADAEIIRSETVGWTTFSSHRGMGKSNVHSNNYDIVNCWAGWRNNFYPMSIPRGIVIAKVKG